jgi:hypothetical protein
MSTSETANAHGHCLCGGVKYEVFGPLREITYCHCEMCRRSTGHYFASTACEKADMRFVSADSLKWYESSEFARRGFCGQCGSQLFWEMKCASYIAILAGSLDKPTGLRGNQHIYTASKGDYYEICDGLPQKLEWES